MTYVTVVPQACFRIGSVSEGTCIHSWWREVSPASVQFTAQCGPNDGSGSCALCWKQSANSSGQLVLTYTCDDIDCLSAKKTKAGSGGGGCVLEYSLDGQTYYPASASTPAASVNCFFRCRCTKGMKPKRKAQAKRKPKAKKAAAKKKAGPKSKKAKSRKR